MQNQLRWYHSRPGNGQQRTAESRAVVPRDWLDQAPTSEGSIKPAARPRCRDTLREGSAKFWDSSKPLLDLDDSASPPAPHNGAMQTGMRAVGGGMRTA